MDGMHCRPGRRNTRAAIGSAQTALPFEGSIRIICPFPAGGSSDAMARLIADKMQATFGRSVIVENKTGAGGRIGAEHMKTVPADGSQIILATVSIMVLNPRAGEGRLRPRQGFRSDRARGRLPAAARHRAHDRCEGPRRAGRLAQGQSGQGELRRAGGRKLAAPLRHPAFESGECADGDGALPWRRADRNRSDRWPDRGRNRRDGRLRRAASRRHAPHRRAVRHGAHADAPGRADVRRARIQRIRGERLERFLRA